MRIKKADKMGIEIKKQTWNRKIQISCTAITHIRLNLFIQNLVNCYQPPNVILPQIVQFLQTAEILRRTPYLIKHESSFVLSLNLFCDFFLKFLLKYYSIYYTDYCPYLCCFDDYIFGKIWEYLSKSFIE